MYYWLYIVVFDWIKHFMNLVCRPNNTLWNMGERAKVLISVYSWLTCQFTSKGNVKDQGLCCVAPCHFLTSYQRVFITKDTVDPERCQPDTWPVLQHIVVILLTCPLVMTFMLPVILTDALYDCRPFVPLQTSVCTPLPTSCQGHHMWY